MSESDQDIIDAAVDFLRRSEEAESENRRNFIAAVKFRAGQQWPAEIEQSRLLEQRPCLTINKTDAYCLQVSNQQRQQRPRIKVDPTNNEATKKKADVIKGMIRHIEATNGGADLAYDTGFDSTITGGWGYWRVMADYLTDTSFDQELYLAPIDNPLSCYGDPNSVLPDGSDQEEFLIADTIPKPLFKKQYPQAEDTAGFTAMGTGDDSADWITVDNVRVAEYYRIKRTPDTLCKLSDDTTDWKSEMPSEEELAANGVWITDKRPVMRRTVQWFKLTAAEILERRTLRGRYIPVVKISGKVEVIDGKRMLSGLVKNAMDPARAFNFWRTAMTETVALAPKAKWLIAEGQDEGHENEWATANTSAKATLRYKPTDVAGAPAQPPQRLQPEPPPEGAMVMANSVGDDLTSVLGIVDPAMRIGGNVSGKALQSERLQSDNSTFHYYDNMTRSIAFTGRILLDLIPHYYAGERIVRIVGDDGRATLQAINDIEQNDITVGAYDVVMDTGPGYTTQRQEAVSYMGPLFERDPELMKVAGDLFFRNIDGPGSELIADRLAAMNPMSQIDEQSDVPPGAQMKIKQQDATIKQMQQALQEAEMEKKYRMEAQKQKDDAATQRTLMQTTAQIHIEDQENRAWMQDTAVNAATKRHDTEVRAQTALNVAEINALRELLKTSVNNSHDLKRLEHEADQSERELKAKSDSTEPV